MTAKINEFSVLNDKAGVMTVPRRWFSRSKWSFANCDNTRQTDSWTSAPRRHVSNAAQPIRQVPRRSPVKSSVNNDRQLEVNLIRSGVRSQLKLARVSVMWAEQRRPAIGRAPALSTDFRRSSKLAGRPTNVALP